MLFIEIKRAHKHHDVILTVGAVLLLNVNKSNDLKVAHPFPVSFLFIIAHFNKCFCRNMLQNLLSGTVSYDAGTTYTIGNGVSLGPYDYSSTMCSDACTEWAYQGQDCRAFAHRYSVWYMNLKFIL